MNFGQAISTCFSKYVTFTGRASRPEFWWFFLFQVIVLIVTGMKEIFSPATGVPLDAPHIIGAVSVVFWGLMMIVTLKYILLILRADNNGEGGIMTTISSTAACACIRAW